MINSKNVAAILCIDRKVMGNWHQRRFITPTFSDRRGKRKHIQFYDDREIFWCRVLSLLACQLSMEYIEVVNLRESIMAAYDQNKPTWTHTVDAVQVKLDLAATRKWIELRSKSGKTANG